MSKAEEFIIEHTSMLKDSNGKEYFKWLTPDQAREAVDIAREEVIEKAVKWLEPRFKNYAGHYFCNVLIKEFKEAINVLETDIMINQKHNMKNYPDSIYLTPVWFNDDKLLSEFWYDSPVSSEAIEYVSKDKTIENVIKKTIEWIKYNNENGGCNFDGWENDLRCTLIND